VLEFLALETIPQGNKSFDILIFLGSATRREKQVSFVVLVVSLCFNSALGIRLGSDPVARIVAVVPL